MNDQPEALRVADWLERDGANCQQHLDAARLLREQHEEIEELRELHQDVFDENMDMLEDEIQELREANETFGKRQEWWSEKMLQIETEVERLRHSLHHISLASQNSMSSKEECGRIARAALEAPR